MPQDPDLFPGAPGAGGRPPGGASVRAAPGPPGGAPGNSTAGSAGAAATPGNSATGPAGAMDVTAAAPDAPLAERMRPRRVADILGQEEILGPDAVLRRAVERSLLPSLLLWGPPGCGKTTLARALSAEVDAEFREISAVSSGVKVLRELIGSAPGATGG